MTTNPNTSPKVTAIAPSLKRCRGEAPTAAAEAARKKHKTRVSVPEDEDEENENELIARFEARAAFNARKSRIKRYIQYTKEQRKISTDVLAEGVDYVATSDTELHKAYERNKDRPCLCQAITCHTCNLKRRVVPADRPCRHKTHVETKYSERAWMCPGCHRGFCCFKADERQNCIQNHLMRCPEIASLFYDD